MESIREATIADSFQPSRKSRSTETQFEEEAEEERNRKKNSFLNFFRKNVDESVIIESKERERDREAQFSSTEELRLGDTDKINMPRTIKSPKHMQLLRSKEQRCATEEEKENGHIESKATSHRRDRSESQ
jgi:hypothetical protein